MGKSRGPKAPSRWTTGVAVQLGPRFRLQQHLHIPDLCPISSGAQAPSLPPGPPARLRTGDGGGGEVHEVKSCVAVRNRHGAAPLWPVRPCTCGDKRPHAGRMQPLASMCMCVPTSLYNSMGPLLGLFLASMLPRVFRGSQCGYGLVSGSQCSAVHAQGSFWGGGGVQPSPPQWC